MDGEAGVEAEAEVEVERADRQKTVHPTEQSELCKTACHASSYRAVLFGPPENGENVLASTSTSALPPRREDFLPALSSAGDPPAHLCEAHAAVPSPRKCP